MEVTLTTPVAYKKIMMLALVEDLMKDVLIFSTLLVVFLFNAISFLTPLLCSFFLRFYFFVFFFCAVCSSLQVLKKSKTPTSCRPHVAPVVTKRCGVSRPME
jgi:hypothetical protein